MKTIESVLDFIQEQIEYENDFLKEDLSDSSHTRTAAIAAKDAYLQVINFIKKEVEDEKRN